METDWAFLKQKGCLFVSQDDTQINVSKPTYVTLNLILW